MNIYALDHFLKIYQIQKNRQKNGKNIVRKSLQIMELLYLYLEIKKIVKETRLKQMDAGRNIK
jgi:hypothetical protein